MIGSRPALVQKDMLIVFTTAFPASMSMWRCERSVIWNFLHHSGHLLLASVSWLIFLLDIRMKHIARPAWPRKLNLRLSKNCTTFAPRCPPSVMGYVGVKQSNVCAYVTSLTESHNWNERDEVMASWQRLPISKFFDMTCTQELSLSRRKNSSLRGYVLFFASNFIHMSREEIVSWCGAWRVTYTLQYIVDCEKLSRPVQ
jgi:hypothetical protein